MAHVYEPTTGRVLEVFSTEPAMQFYTGKDRKLYEVVVFGMDKNKVTGYLATPKVLIAQAQ